MDSGFNSGMNSPCALNVRGRNHLLDLVPAGEREALLRDAQRVKVEHGDLLFERDQAITQVDFPLLGVCSVVIDMEEGGVAEVGTVGNEGFVGLPLLLGAERSPSKAFYQVPGEVLRIPAQTLLDELARRATLDAVLRRYAQCYLNQVSQSAACNRLHPLEQRLCRWILQSHDRYGADTVPLTQEFLAEMLGVRRATVSIAAGMLQKAGWIRYRRGTVDVLDRAGLEEGSCECYAVVRKEYERLLC